MKYWKRTIILGIALCFLTGCTKKLTPISYQELKKLQKEKETFILEVMQDGCSHCEEFSPRLEKIIKKYKVENAYQLNMSTLSKEDEKDFLETLGITSTPITCFYKKGKELGELYRIEGAVSDSLVIKKLENLKYIK